MFVVLKSAAGGTDNVGEPHPMGFLLKPFAVLER